MARGQRAQVLRAPPTHLVGLGWRRQQTADHSHHAQELHACQSGGRKPGYLQKGHRVGSGRWPRPDLGMEGSGGLGSRIPGSPNPAAKCRDSFPQSPGMPGRKTRRPGAPDHLPDPPPSALRHLRPLRPQENWGAECGCLDPMARQRPPHPGSGVGQDPRDLYNRTPPPRPTCERCGCCKRPGCPRLSRLPLAARAASQPLPCCRLGNKARLLLDT